jgi:outer membrane protein assembly factor BamB
VTFRHAGYIETTQLYEVVGGAVRDRQIVLLPRSDPQLLDGVLGASLSIPGTGGSLTVPALALEDHFGNPLTSVLQAQISFIDVSDQSQMAAAPGDYRARQLDSSEVQLQSFGMVEIRVDDGLGGEAQLADGKSAQLLLPIPPALQAAAPSSMGLYSFAPDEGLWIEEGTLTKDGSGQYYDGELTHFSVWNADLAIDVSCMQIQVFNGQNKPVAGATVVALLDGAAGAAIGTTGSDGMACINAMHNCSAIVYAELNGARSDAKSVMIPASVMNCAEDPASCLNLGQLTLHEPPEARFTATPPGGPTPLAVTFDASTSTPGDAPITKYEWDFDGPAGGYVWVNQGTNPMASHTYDSPGSFYPTLRLTDENGLTSMKVAWLVTEGASARGDWYVVGHDPQRTFRSSFVGPQSNHLLWQGDSTSDSVVEAGMAMAADGTIYVSDIDFHLNAFNSTDGSLNWQSTLMGDRAQVTPAVANDGTVFVAADDEKMYAFNPLDGSIDWSFFILAADDISFAADDSIYCSTWSLYRVDPVTHLQLWRQDGLNTGYCVAQGYDGTLYTGSSYGQLYAINPASGDLIWKTSINGGLTCPAAVGLDGTIFVGGTDYATGSGAVYAFRSGNGALRWKALIGSDRCWGEGPAIGPDGRVIVFNDYEGIVYAFEPTLGTQLWVADQTPDCYYSCNPAIGADGKIYLGGTDNKLHALNPDNGAEVWASGVLGTTMIDCTPLIGPDGTLYVINQSGEFFAFRDP